jgi:hypothetical protein
MEKRDIAAELLRLRSRMEASAMDDRAKERELLRFAGENMDQTQQSRLQNVLRDRQALQTLLESDSAKALLRRLRQDK